MNLVDLLPLFAQSGVMGLIALVATLWHRDAIRVHDQRAKDWRAVAEQAQARADERDRQLIHLLSAVKDTTAPTTETV